MTRRLLLALLVCSAFILVSCSAGSALSQGDQVATLVAATLQSQIDSTDTAAPIDGEIQPQSGYGDCANTGQLSIAYVKDNNVWLWVQGGPHLQLTDTGDAYEVRISPDGCRVAYSRGIPDPAYDASSESSVPPQVIELWMVSSDGSQNQQLAGMDLYGTFAAPPEGAAYNLYHFAWQPGTHTLAFNTRLGFAGPGLALSNDIYLINADTLNLSTLMPPGDGGEFSFSNDGQLVAFSTPTSINVVDTDGSNLRTDLVNFPLVLTYSEYQYYPPIHWTPANNGFMVAVPPEDGLATPQNGLYPETSLWYVPLDGTPAFEAGSIQSVWFPIQPVAFSPDAGRIAYLRPVGDPAANQQELVIALSNGSNESAQLNYPQIKFQSWSPDNSQFMYSYADDTLRLVISDVNASIVAPLALPATFPADSLSADWVTDDALVLLLQGPGGFQLSLMGLDGNNQVIDTMNAPGVSYDVAD